MDQWKEHKILKALQQVMGIAVLATICIVTFGVVARLLHIPAAWTDEVVRIIFIWLVFIGGAVAYSSNALIGLDLVEDLLSKKPAAQKALKIAQALFGLTFGVFMTMQTFKIFSTQLASGETTPVLLIPLWLVNFGYFLGAVLFVVFALRKLAEILIRPKQAEEQ